MSAANARPILLVGGKGGVGKTTVAAALATALAAAGEHTLLVSTDPAHSTADLLGARIGDEPTPLSGDLAAVEIDAEQQADAHVERVRADVHRLVAPEVRDTVDRHLDLARRGAGTLESAVIDRLATLLDERPGRYERVVVDTAPTGHTLRLLAMPELVTGWIEGLVRQRERVRGMDRMLRNLAGDQTPVEDPVLDRLREQRSRLQRLRRRLVDDATFHPVLVPERLPIEETARAVPALEEAGLHVGAIVVNRVLPADADGTFLADRREQQEVYLTEIRRRLGDHELVGVPQQRRDVTGPAGLEELGAHLGPLLARARGAAGPG